VPVDQVSFNFERMSIEASGKGGPTSVSCNFGGLSKEAGHDHSHQPHQTDVRRATA
jgi:hypothetical protein